MNVKALKQEFNVRYYYWALEDFRREIAPMGEWTVSTEIDIRRRDTQLNGVNLEQ